MSVGFKNGTDGSIGIAIDAIKAAGSGHTFLSVTKQGLSAIVETEGNSSTHVILRGSSKGPNYGADDVAACAEKLNKSGLPAKIMVCFLTIFSDLMVHWLKQANRLTALTVTPLNNTSTKLRSVPTLPPSFLLAPHPTSSSVS